MSMQLKIWKRLITDQLSVSPHRQLSVTISLLPSLPFNLKPHNTFANFCTQTVAKATSPPQSGVVTEFLVSKCGLTDEDIKKAFRHDKSLLRTKSIRNMEEVFEMLNGFGLTTPAQMRKVVVCNPKIFFYNAKNNLQSKFTLLRTFIKEDDVSKVIYSNANVIKMSEDRLKSSFSLLKKLGMEGDALSALVAKQPRLLCSQEQKVAESFKLVEALGVKKGTKMFAAVLQCTFGAGKEKIDRRLQVLSSFGFTVKQISQICVKMQWILGISEEKLKRNVDFLVNSAGLPLDALVKYSRLFTCSLEKRIIPRYRVMEALKSMQVLKREPYFPYVVQLTEKLFLEKYVKSPDVRDIYHGRKTGDLIIDTETCSKYPSIKIIRQGYDSTSSAALV